MSTLRDMAATWAGPARTVQRLLDRGQREDRALAILMASCGLIFVAQWPRLARQAHVEQTDIDPLLAGSLLAWIFIAPLLLYGIGALAHMIARIVGGQGTFWRARLATFWAVFASTPVILLHGLVAGFIGPGPQLVLVGVVWLAVFLWFWLSGLWVAERPA